MKPRSIVKYGIDLFTLELEEYIVRVNTEITFTPDGVKYHPEGYKNPVIIPYHDMIEIIF